MEMQDFQKDVLLHIFSFVSLKDRIASLQYVNKQFHHLVWDNSLLKEFDFQQNCFYRGTTEIKFIKRYSSQIRKLILKKYNCNLQGQERIVNLISLCVNMESLNIMKVVYLKPDGLYDILKNMVNLKELSVMALAEGQLGKLVGKPCLNLALKKLTIQCSRGKGSAIKAIPMMSFFLRTHMVVSHVTDYVKIITTLDSLVKDGDNYEYVAVAENFKDRMKFLDIFLNIFDIATSIHVTQNFPRGLGRTDWEIVLAELYNTKLSFRVAFCLQETHIRTLCEVRVCNNNSERKIVHLDAILGNLRYSSARPSRGMLSDDDLNSVKKITACIVECENQNDYEAGFFRIMHCSWYSFMNLEEINLSGSVIIGASPFSLMRNISGCEKLKRLGLVIQAKHQDLFLANLLDNLKNPQNIEKIDLSLDIVLNIPRMHFECGWIPEPEDSFTEPCVKRPRLKHPHDHVIPESCNIIWRLVRKCPNITSIAIVGKAHTNCLSHSLEPLEGLRHLKELHIENVCVNQCRFMNRILYGCRKLSKLALMGVECENSLELINFLTNNIYLFDKLECFYFSHFQHQFPIELLEALAHNTLLKEIHLVARRYGWKWDNNINSVHAHLLKKLKYLQILEIFSQEYLNREAHQSLKKIANKKIGYTLIAHDLHTAKISQSKLLRPWFADRWPSTPEVN